MIDGITYGSDRACIYRSIHVGKAIVPVLCAYSQQIVRSQSNAFLKIWQLLCWINHITKSHFWLMDFQVAVDSLRCLMEILFALWYLTTRIGRDSSLSHASAFHFQHKSVWLHDFCTLPWLCSPLSIRYSSLFCSCVQASWLHSAY